MDISKIPVNLRKAYENCENGFSIIIEKIKNALIKLERDASFLNYKEVRVMREELLNIKKNYDKFLSPRDISNMKDIVKLMAKIKKSHPHLCSKSFHTTSNTTRTTFIDDQQNEQAVSDNLIHSVQLPSTQSKCLNEELSTVDQTPMEIDESLMNLNNKKLKSPTRAEDINMEEQKPPVASEKSSQPTKELNRNLLNPIQKLYLESLELWQFVDEFEMQKKRSSNNNFH